MKLNWRKKLWKNSFTYLLNPCCFSPSFAQLSFSWSPSQGFSLSFPLSCFTYSHFMFLFSEVFFPFPFHVFLDFVCPIYLSCPPSILSSLISFHCMSLFSTVFFISILLFIFYFVEFFYHRRIIPIYLSCSIGLLYSFPVYSLSLDIFLLRCFCYLFAPCLSRYFSRLSFSHSYFVDFSYNPHYLPSPLQMSFFSWSPA